MRQGVISQPPVIFKDAPAGVYLLLPAIRSSRSKNRQ